MSDEPRPRRHWFKSSLRTLLAVVAVLGIWLGWHVNIVRQRHAMRTWINEHGGTVDVFSRPEPIEIVPGLYHLSYQRVLGPEQEPEIPRWRHWLGDEAINYIIMPTGTSAADLMRAKALFPEGTVEIVEVTATGRGGGMF